MFVPALEPSLLFLEQERGERTGPADLEALKAVNQYQSHNPSPEGAGPTTSRAQGEESLCPLIPGEMWEPGHSLGDVVPMRNEAEGHES